MSSPKYGTTRKNAQWYYTTKHLIRYTYYVACICSWYNAHSHWHCSPLMPMGCLWASKKKAKSHINILLRCQYTSNDHLNLAQFCMNTSKITPNKIYKNLGFPDCTCILATAPLCNIEGMQVLIYLNALERQELSFGKCLSQERKSNKKENKKFWSHWELLIASCSQGRQLLLCTALTTIPFVDKILHNLICTEVLGS